MQQYRFRRRGRYVTVTPEMQGAGVVASGVNLIVLLALSDDGHPSFNQPHAEQIASLGCPDFACTPDQFPELMAAALAGKPQNVVT